MTQKPDRDQGTTLAAVSEIRHDVNNLLMGLIGYVELLQGNDQLPDDVRTRLDTIATQIQRIRDRVADLSAIGPDPQKASR